MKILIIRFSSFGDVLQCLSVAGSLQDRFPNAEIHWLTREDFVPLVETHPAVRKVWTVSRRQGLGDLVKLAWTLRRSGFTHVYDAHNNLRSHLIGWIMKGFLDWRHWFGRVHFLRRSIYRLRRFLLFSFRWNLFPKPFSGQGALLEPLRRWNVSQALPANPQLHLPLAVWTSVAEKHGLRDDGFVTLAPSAAFPLKRWPVDHWKDLIREMAAVQFVLLGGKEDEFLAEIVPVAPDRVVNLAGKLDLIESAAVIAHSRALVANDTGLMHVAEQTGKPCLALMGPAPFGFPSRPSTRILELNLACRPCSKHGQGPCTNPVFQQCLRDIQPGTVARDLKAILGRPLDAGRDL